MIKAINLDKIFYRFKRQQEVQLPKTSITFSINEMQVSERIEEISMPIARIVGRVGVGYAYVLGSGFEKLSTKEISDIEDAKSQVIEVLSKSSSEIDLSMLSNARDIAYGFLLKNFGLEKAKFFSNIIAHDTVGYGPLSILLEDKQNIEEIEVNAPNSPISIYHVRYGRCATNLSFNSEDNFRININKMVYQSEKELNEDSPIIDAQISDSRVHAQIKPFSLTGAAASIRLGSRKELSINYLAKKETLDFTTLSYIWLAIESGLNIVVAGAPASGKTTVLNAITSFIPRFQKVVGIEEDVHELRFYPNLVSFVPLQGSRFGRVTTKEQVINALRMRPDRLIVGEIRWEEAKELFSGANLGMPFMTTMHSSEGALSIVKKLMIKPMEVQPDALSMLDLAIYMKEIDLRRKVFGIYEYKWLSRAETLKGDIDLGNGNAFEISRVMENCSLDRVSLENSKVVVSYSNKTGLSKRLVIKEMHKRATFLEDICKDAKVPLEIYEKIYSYGLPK